METINVRLDKDVYEKIKAIAEKECRTFKGQVRFMLNEEKKTPKPKEKKETNPEIKALSKSWLWYWQQTKKIDYQMQPKDYAALKRVAQYLRTLSEDHSEETLNELFKRLLNHAKNDKFYCSLDLNGFAGQIQRISADYKSGGTPTDSQSWADIINERYGNKYNGS